MAVETEEDRKVFFDPDEFGTAAVYRAAPGEPDQPVNVLFSNAHEELPVTEGLAHSGRSPAVVLREEALEAPPRRDGELELGETVYRVRDVQPDGEGLSTLILEV